MPHDEPSRIGIGGKAIILAACDLHLILVEAMPQIAGRDAKWNPFGSSIAKGAFGRCSVCACVTTGTAPFSVNPPHTGGNPLSTDPSRSRWVYSAAVSCERPLAPGKK